MFESVYSADQWYAGMADAAFERSITLQYCLPSPTDIMVALKYPAVVQVRRLLSPSNPRLYPQAGNRALDRAGPCKRRL